VHNVVLVEHLEGINQLLEDEKRLFLKNNPVLTEHALESTTVAVLIHEVEIVWSFKHVDVFDDVFVFLYVRQDIDLVNSTLLQLLILLKTTHLNDLDRVLSVIILVHRTVHLTVGTLPNYFVKGVVFDYADHGY
jgi:hypothetical protein